MFHGSIKYACKSTKNILHQSERILENLIYIKLVGILYRWFLCKRKKIEICDITANYVSFEVHFVRHLILVILRKS